MRGLWEYDYLGNGLVWSESLLYLLGGKRLPLISALRTGSIASTRKTRKIFRNMAIALPTTRWVPTSWTTVCATTTTTGYGCMIGVASLRLPKMAAPC